MTDCECNRSLKNIPSKIACHRCRTCVKYDFITSKSAYMGGAISQGWDEIPGLHDTPPMYADYSWWIILHASTGIYDQAILRGNIFEAPVAFAILSFPRVSLFCIDSWWEGEWCDLKERTGCFFFSNWERAAPLLTTEERMDASIRWLDKIFWKCRFS